MTVTKYYLSFMFLNVHSYCMNGEILMSKILKRKKDSNYNKKDGKMARQILFITSLQKYDL